jgi:hypothetical protein
MKIEVYPYTVETTEDCLILIDPFKQHNFKRKSKFKIKVDHFDQDVSVFHDAKSEQTYSVINEGDQVKIMEIDLSNFKSLIKEIQEHAKNVYTHDYGETWLNPFTKTLWVSGGDGGIVYWNESPIKLAKLIERGNNLDFDGDLGFLNISEIKEEIVEAESGPYNEEGFDDQYILVAKCRDITDYIDF